MSAATLMKHTAATPAGWVIALALCWAPQAQAASETRSVAYVYDTDLLLAGHVLRDIVEPQNSNLCLVTEYSYNAVGDRITVAQRNCNGTAIPDVGQEAAAPTGLAVFAGISAQYRHDYPGLDGATERRITATNALGHQSVQVLDRAFGTPVQATDANGLVTRWRYDGFGRRTLEQRPDGTGTRWAYDLCSGTVACPNSGNVTPVYRMSRYDVSGANVTTDAGVKSGPYSYTYHDKLDRVIAEETEGRDIGGAARSVRQLTAYDAFGRIDTQTRPYFTDAGTAPATGNAAYDFDALGRSSSETRFDGGDTQLSYDGLKTQRLVRVLSAATTFSTQTQQSITETRNALGQVVGIKDSNGQTLTRTYTPWGDVLSSTDAAGNVVQSVYDLRGRRTRLTDPDIGAWTFDYNPLGQKVRQTDAKGQVTTYEYDLLGRLKHQTETDQESRWTYDTQYANGTACANAKGKLCEATATNGFGRRHSYDTLGRLVNTTTAAAVPGGTGTYQSDITYDSLGRVATRVYPGAAGQRLSVMHTYTALGYLSSVKDSAANTVYWRADRVDEQGRLTQQTYGNGVATARTYDPMGRLLTSIAGAGNAVQNDSYTYDYAGNLRSRGDTRPDAILTAQYDYDNLNRLKTEARSGGGVSGTQTITWSYDDLGNITGRSDVGTYVYPAAGAARPHAVSSITGTVNGAANPSYTYDLNGNVLSSAGRTATWSSFNLPAKLTRGANELSWVYDSEHERVREQLRVSASLIRTTVYVNPPAGAGLFYEEEIAGSVVKRRHYISSDEGAVAMLTRQSGVADQVRYWHKDQLGSTDVVSNESGGVVERLGYEPFGKRRQSNGSTDANGTLTSSSTDRGFTGHEMLDEIGLIHMNGRIYDAAIGRFLSADPNVPDPSDPQSYNRYSYVRNRPLTVTDPSGFFDGENDEQALGSGLYGLRALLTTIGPSAASTNFSTQPTGSGFALGYDPVNPFNNNGFGFQATVALQNTELAPMRSPGAAADLQASQALNPVDRYARAMFVSMAKYLEAFQQTEAGRNLQALPPEGAAIGGLKAGLFWLGRVAKAEEVAAGAAKETVRVGRWMSEAELKAMQGTGRVVESRLNGVTSVTSPPNAMKWMTQTEGTHFVEFNISRDALRASDGVTGKIFGPNSIFGPKLGITEMPAATDILHTATKLP